MEETGGPGVSRGVGGGGVMVTGQSNTWITLKLLYFHRSMF